jgi:hypothetical protein
MRDIYLHQNSKIKHLEENNTNLPDHKHKFYKRIENLTNVQFTTEETSLLKRGLNYNLQQKQRKKDRKHSIRSRNCRRKTEPVEQYATRYFFPRGSTVLEGPWPPHI